MACAWLTAIGAGVYYGFSLIWPQCVAFLYTDIQSQATFNTLSGLAPMCFVIGQIVGGFFGTFTEPKPFIIFTMTTSTPILCAAAADPLNQSLTMGLMIVGCLLVGSMECISIATTTFPLRTQEEIGTAGDLSGSIRAFGSVIAIAVFTTTLRNRLGTTIPQYVIPAAENAGLPASSIPSLISGLTGTTKLNAASVPGLTPSILSAASQAYKVANSHAFSTVFLASFAFGGCGLILCWFVAQNDASQQNFISSHIHSTKEEKALEAQEG